MISRVFLLGCLMIKAKSQMKLNLIKKDIFKPIIASIIMSFFLMLYLQIINLNFILGIIGLIFGILVYFISLWLVKGIGIEDLKLLKSFKKEKVQKINL